MNAQHPWGEHLRTAAQIKDADVADHELFVPVMEAEAVLAGFSSLLRGLAEELARIEEMAGTAKDGSAEAAHERLLEISRVARRNISSLRDRVGQERTK